MSFETVTILPDPPTAEARPPLGMILLAHVGHVA